MSGSRVAAVVVAHNGGQDLRECVASLLAQTVEDLEIIVVDNASQDWSSDSFDQSGDRVRVIRRATNGGYAAGANTGWQATSADLIAVLNQDLVLAPDCLERMRDVLLSYAGEALVTPKLVLKSAPGQVNAIGNSVHLSGVASCNGIGTPADAWRGVHQVTAISGAAFLARRGLLESLGGMEEAYFMYLEDVDLSMRARDAGAVCVAACDAVAVHDWQLAMGSDRFELLERNRRALWERFWGRRLDLYPYLVQAELMAWAYALLRGRAHVKAKQAAGHNKLALPGLTGMPSARLEAALSRSHPYELLFPGRPIVWRLGHALDHVVSALAFIVRIVSPRRPRSDVPARS